MEVSPTDGSVAATAASPAVLKRARASVDSVLVKNALQRRKDLQDKKVNEASKDTSADAVVGHVSDGVVDAKIVPFPFGGGTGKKCAMKFDGDVSNDDVIVGGPTSSLGDLADGPSPFQPCSGGGGKSYAVVMCGKMYQADLVEVVGRGYPRVFMNKSLYKESVQVISEGLPGTNMKAVTSPRSLCAAAQFGCEVYC
jgi:hypothetical protein